MNQIRSGAADSLMDSLVAALGVPPERVVEFWMHRTQRGRTVITVRFDAADVEAPPIERVYQLTEVSTVEPAVVRPGTETLEVPAAAVFDGGEDDQQTAAKTGSGWTLFGRKHHI